MEQTRNEIIAKVKCAIQEKVNCLPEEITDEANLKKTFDMDDADIISLVAELTEDYTIDPVLLNKLFDDRYDLYTVKTLIDGLCMALEI